MVTEMDDPPADAVDIGGDTRISRVVDRAGEWVGITEWHRRPPAGRWCGGWVPFDVPANRWRPGQPVWQVESWEPLTLSPSLLCSACGHHGFIRSGRWQAA